MNIISSGNTSDTLAQLSSEYTGKAVLGVSLHDLILTIENRGYEHFDDVRNIIITDGALDSLTDLSDLNKLVPLKGTVYFINRQYYVTKTQLLSEEIKQIELDILSLDDINRIVLGGI